MGNVTPRKLELADSVVSIAGHSGSLLSWWPISFYFCSRHGEQHVSPNFKGTKSHVPMPHFSCYRRGWKIKENPNDGWAKKAISFFQSRQHSSLKSEWIINTTQSGGQGGRAREIKKLMVKEKKGMSGGRKEYRGTLSLLFSIINLKFLIYPSLIT